MAMGGAAASGKKCSMGEREILQNPRRPQLGVSAIEKQKDGSRKEVVLLKEADTPIVRHVKIKAGANPHDPKWEAYFEARWGRKTMNSPRRRVKLYRVWLRQDGRCSICQDPITPASTWVTRCIET